MSIRARAVAARRAATRPAAPAFDRRRRGRANVRGVTHCETSDSVFLDHTWAAGYGPAPSATPCEQIRLARKAPSFQDLILVLQRYWAEQGCAILQPYDVEVGAGTFHPATTLRALGPEPWRAAYVQPSRRPKDGRYGENPNRLQHYYQYQVILKPSPPD